VEQRMKIEPTDIEGVMVVKNQLHIDHRGAFVRFFCGHDLGSVIQDRRIVQINHSRTTNVGSVRGMHFQHPPHAEMKLVRCLKGRVWDVAVDLRAGSSTFLCWHAEELTPENVSMLIIPEGCAHGFQVLEPDSELLYLHTAFYTPKAEDGVRYDDSRLSITWPLPVTDISLRDIKHPNIALDFPGINI
jgi:dTDP-4-dehydrorhamnose 3,5-epimerase